jgi:hypothetical protein
MFLISLSPPVVRELHLSEGQRAVSTVDLIQSEYDQKHLSLSNYWTLDHWMSSGSLAGVTPLTRLANLPRPEMCSTLHWKIFSAQHSLFTRDTVTNRARLTFVECCSSIPTCLIVSSMFFTMGNQEFQRGFS